MERVEHQGTLRLPSSRGGMRMRELSAKSVVNFTVSPPAGVCHQLREVAKIKDLRRALLAAGFVASRDYRTVTGAASDVRCFGQGHERLHCG
jgi:hypothetical protein